MLLPITREGKIIGSIATRVDKRSGFFVHFFADCEPSDIDFQGIFGKADYEVLLYVDGTGCYQKVKEAVIHSWKVEA